MSALQSGVLFLSLSFCVWFTVGAAGCAPDRATAEDKDLVDASLEAFGCKQECELALLSPCTCGPDDPCGWRHDGVCDRKCLFSNIVERMFDDSLDCPGPCDGACEGRFYTSCSCAEDDPCEWADDGDCDIQCLEDEKVETMFDDSADCPAYFEDAGPS